MVVSVYLSRRNERLRLAESGASGVVTRGERQVSSNVVFLGLTSMFTDISSEMVTAILPVYLTFQLRFTPLQFGTFDGLYQSLAAVVLVAGALVADSRKRHKEVAGLGYALSAGCKLGLLASGGAWLPTVTSLYVDRTGKGMRTAPRDALISLSSAPARLARSFGTLQTGGHTYLVAGSVGSPRLRVLREGVECPSLSPDNTRIVFKRARLTTVGLVQWRLNVLDLKTLKARPLAETRNVDDQVEWLDNDTVLYMVDTGVEPTNVWAVRADGTGTPRVFIQQADSPAVVHS